MKCAAYFTKATARSPSRTKPRCAAVQQVVGYWKCCGPSAPLGRTAALRIHPSRRGLLIEVKRTAMVRRGNVHFLSAFEWTTGRREWRPSAADCEPVRPRCMYRQRLGARSLRQAARGEAAGPRALVSGSAKYSRATSLVGAGLGWGPMWRDGERASG